MNPVGSRLVDDGYDGTLFILEEGRQTLTAQDRRNFERHVDSDKKYGIHHHDDPTVINYTQGLRNPERNQVELQEHL